MEERAKQRYRQMQKLSGDGMMQVDLVWDSIIQGCCVRKQAKKDAFARTMIAQEAKLLGALSHPQIPRLLDYQPQEGYLIMEYMPGETLEQLFLRDGPFAPAQVIRWGIALCDLLSYLHTRRPAIIYRDLKPSNVIVSTDGCLALIDLGAARLYHPDKGRDTHLLGTCGFAPPELYGGLGQSDVRSDVYSLGVLLYQLWDKTQAYGPLAKVLRRATSYAPDDRYCSCAHMKAALEAGASSRKGNGVGTFAVRAALLAGSVIIAFAWLRGRYEESVHYEQLLRAAEKESGEPRWTLCVQAMEIRPQDKAAYLCLLQGFAQDGCFDEEEERYWKQEVAPLLEVLRQGGEYAAVAYAVGELYWYGYERADAQLSISAAAMQAATPWFQDVLQTGKETSAMYQNAMIYQAIGSFYQDIVWSIRTAREAGRYLRCWEELIALRETIEREAQADGWMRLQLDQLMIDFVMGHLWELRADGVEKATMTEALSQCYERIRLLPASSARERTVQARLLQQETTLWRTLSRAYEEE